MKMKYAHSGGGGQKSEPNPRAVNPAYAAGIGAKIGNHAMDQGTIRAKHEQMYEGRGYKAPGTGRSNHGNSGTQGRH